MLHDVKFALRTMVRNRAFFAFAIGVLALAIGANTAIFSVAYSVLLRRLPYHDANRLVMVWEDAAAFGFPQNTPAPGNFASWKADNSVFSDMAALSSPVTFDFTGHGSPEQFLGAQMTANMLPLLGVRPALGRNMSAAEDQPDGNPVVILSHGLWMADFGGNPNVLGKRITLNHTSYAVIGVMPRGFVFPDRSVQIWTPIALSRADLVNHGSHYLEVVARLKPGVTLAGANADLAIVARRLQKEFPATNTKVGAFAQPLRENLEGTSRLAALVLAGAVGLVLLIGCANLTNLLLARATGRNREMALRMALGAGRGTVLRQLLTESMVLSFLGGGVGLLLALWMTPFLARLVPVGMAPLHGAGINGEVLAFLAGIAILCGILSGLAPALRLSRLGLASAMKQGGAQSGGGGHAARMREVLVIGEVALALMLFYGAVLMLRSFVNVRDLDPGFQPAHVLVAQTQLPSPQYDLAARRTAYWEQVLARVRHLPGVVAAGCVTWLPLTNWGGAGGITIPGRPAGDASHVVIPNLRMIGGRYLQAMGMRLIAGRGLDAADTATAQRVALVNQTAARRLWPGVNPIGSRFTRDGKAPYRWITVVGIVGDVRAAGLDKPARPTIYLPYQQWDYYWPSYLAVRTRGDPMALASAVRRQVWAVDRDEPVTAVMPLTAMLENDLAPRELQSGLLGGFAAFALLLAALGLYAVLAFSVAQRRQEIGVRMALGAQRKDIVGSVVGRGLKIALLGVVLGAAGALGLGQVLARLLYGVPGRDPAMLAAAAAVLLCAALAASYLPARRATRLDPLQALRYE
ncbi:MAG: ABC transporter permease [Terriglobales bacterium]